MFIYNKYKTITALFKANVWIAVDLHKSLHMDINLCIWHVLYSDIYFINASKAIYLWRLSMYYYIIAETYGFLYYFVSYLCFYTTETKRIRLSILTRLWLYLYMMFCSHLRFFILWLHLIISCLNWKSRMNNVRCDVDIILCINMFLFAISFSNLS